MQGVIILIMNYIHTSGLCAAVQCCNVQAKVLLHNYVTHVILIPSTILKADPY